MRKPEILAKIGQTVTYRYPEGTNRNQRANGKPFPVEIIKYGKFVLNKDRPGNRAPTPDDYVEPNRYGYGTHPGVLVWMDDRVDGGRKLILVDTRALFDEDPAEAIEAWNAMKARKDAEQAEHKRQEIENERLAVSVLTALGISPVDEDGRRANYVNYPRVELRIGMPEIVKLAERMGILPGVDV